MFEFDDAPVGAYKQNLQSGALDARRLQDLAQKNALPLGIADGPILPLQPFLRRLIVDSPVAGALDDGGERRARHRLYAIEIKFEGPLDRPIDTKSPFSLIEVGRWEMVAHEE